MVMENKVFNVFYNNILINSQYASNMHANMHLVKNPRENWSLN